MKIAIIGAGWTGLILAHRLSTSSHSLSVFDREDQPGGLATFHNYGPFFWDRFYHVILPMDQALTGFLEEIGLGSRLRWERTLTGVYVDKQFYSISSTKEFLQFPPLNLFQKFRLALTILAGSRIRDWQKMEKITVEDWLLRYSGKTVYEKFWKPLLLAKLGEDYRKVSAVFIWTYIKRLFAARQTSSERQEKMGYLEGGYKTALDQILKILSERKVSINLSTSIDRIEPAEGAGFWITSGEKRIFFDKVIYTGPVQPMRRIMDPALAGLTGTYPEVEYLGVVCMVLVLKKTMTPYYVLNIADPDIPFTGVIGMSTLVDTRYTGGYHLVYLPKYVHSGDRLLKASDAVIKDLFFEGLHRLYPSYPLEDVVSVHIHRAQRVQPLQVLNYSRIIPKVTSRHKDLYILNTSQFVHDTLNNDSVTRHVNKFMEQYGKELTKPLQNEPSDAYA